jgi:DNA processing protein
MTSSLSSQQLTDWLRLIRSDNVGPSTFRKLLNKFGSAHAALEALPHLSLRGGKSSPTKIPTQSKIEDEIAAIHAFGANIITAADSDFPEPLKHIATSPPIIIIHGSNILNKEKTIAIVGARNASSAGQSMAKSLASDLGDAGYIIVSGLARGIDSAAHQESLTSGTIAVMAGGIDQIYPTENISLANEIIDNGGAIISEMPLGHSPRAKDFPRRNRIISGLSLGTVIIEAAKRSGSLITARYALEQNREVFAVPGSPLDPRSNGPNSLIRQGATLIMSADDIIQNLSTYSPKNNMLFESNEEYSFTPNINKNPKPTKKTINNPSNNERDILLSSLSHTPIAVDEIIQQTNISTLTIQTMLLELDIAGKIEWASGQLVSLKAP